MLHSIYPPVDSVITRDLIRPIIPSVCPPPCIDAVLPTVSWEIMSMFSACKAASVVVPLLIYERIYSVPPYLDVLGICGNPCLTCSFTPFHGSAVCTNSISLLLGTVRNYSRRRQFRKLFPSLFVTKFINLSAELREQRDFFLPPL